MEGMSMNKWNADNIHHINENKTWKVLIHADIFWVIFYQSDKKSVEFLENINQYSVLRNKLVFFFLTHLFWNLRIYISAWWKIQSFNMQKKKKRERRMKKNWSSISENMITLCINKIVFLLISAFSPQTP